jgi:hypothetical protein
MNEMLYDEYKESKAGLLQEVGADRFIDIGVNRKKQIVDNIDNTTLVACLDYREKQFRIDYLVSNSKVRFKTNKGEQK